VTPVPYFMDRRSKLPQLRGAKAHRMADMPNAPVCTGHRRSARYTAMRLFQQWSESDNNEYSDGASANESPDSETEEGHSLTAKQILHERFKRLGPLARAGSSAGRVVPRETSGSTLSSGATDLTPTHCHPPPRISALVWRR
jgi:hypothetical protein